MITPPPVRTPRRALLLVALLGVLIAGVIGTHHFIVLPAAGSASGTVSVEVVSSAPGHPAAVQPLDVPLAHGWLIEHGVEDRTAWPESHADHETSLLHLCLAVLTTLGVLAALVTAWQGCIRTTRVEIRAVGRPDTAPRSPPPTAPVRLALLCVLRT